MTITLLIHDVFSHSPGPARSRGNILSAIGKGRFFNSSYLAISSQCSLGATDLSTVALVRILFLLIFIQWTDCIFGILGPSPALSQYLHVYFIFNSNSNSTHQWNHCPFSVKMLLGPKCSSILSQRPQSDQLCCSCGPQKHGVPQYNCTGHI